MFSLGMACPTFQFDSPARGGRPIAEFRPQPLTLEAMGLQLNGDAPLSLSASFPSPLPSASPGGGNASFPNLFSSLSTQTSPIPPASAALGAPTECLAFSPGVWFPPLEPTQVGDAPPMYEPLPAPALAALTLGSTPSGSPSMGPPHTMTVVADGCAYTFLLIAVSPLPVASTASPLPAQSPDSPACMAGLSAPPAPPGEPCQHRRYWKRLRAKRGSVHFVCLRCGAKWRVRNATDGAGDSSTPEKSPAPEGSAVECPVELLQAA
eukprot:GGOE01022139.1.p1 GENE.GGOE01022139.1~~GGOE01022139.1.p1  ORF type:complete len:279 (+),score=38.42 GGOE01022139.1:45-839(+)